MSPSTKGVSSSQRSKFSQAKRIERIAAALEAEYGSKVWRQGDDPLSQLIKTILSQNTTDTNSLRAFDNLRRRFPTWAEVEKAPVKEVAEAIRSGGLARIKAERIKKILSQVCEAHPGCDLSFLSTWPTEQIKEFLGQFVGVGEKTIACVLLFALGRPVMPVDTHILRVSKRLGLIPEKADAQKAHHLLQTVVPENLIYPLHLNLIQHGRRTCRARNPACRQCVLRRMCLGYPLFVAQSS
jgi:endonuclease-3